MAPQNWHISRRRSFKADNEKHPNATTLQKSRSCPYLLDLSPTLTLSETTLPIKHPNNTPDVFACPPTMSQTTQFSSLPPEIRLQIWRLAAREHRRIIKVDVELQVAISGNWNGIHESTVFGGYFEAQMPSEMESLTWPPASQKTVESLAATCVEARDAVHQEYPDVIQISKQTFNLASARALRRGFSLTKPQELELFAHFVPPKYKLRCNFKTDIFFVREVSESPHFAQSDLQFAIGVWRETIYGMLPSEAKASDLDHFRESLRRIKHLMCEGPKEREAPHLSNRIQQESLKCLFAGMPQLDAFYLCPWGSRFMDKSYHLADLSESVWDGEFPTGIPEYICRQLEDVGQLVRKNLHQFRGQICHRTGTAQRVDTIAKSLNLELRSEHLYRSRGGALASFEKLQSALSRVLPAHGFQGNDDDMTRGHGDFPVDLSGNGQTPIRVREVRLRSSKLDSEGEGDAVWLPKTAGYVSEKSSTPSMTVETYR